MTNAKGLTTYVVRHTYPVRESTTILSATSGKIQVQTADGGRMTCEKLEILVNGVDPLAVSVFNGAIQVSTSKEVKDGSFVQASAKQVSRIGPDEATLVLEGNAKLIYTRGGKKIDVSTDLLSVNLLTGQVISELNAPRPNTPITPTDCDTTAPMPSAPLQPKMPEATPPATQAVLDLATSAQCGEGTATKLLPNGVFPGRS